MCKMFEAKRIVTVFVHVVILISSVHSIEDCVTPRKTPGQCVFINQCPIVQNILKSNPFNQELISHLQEYNCGFEGQTPKVCCEKDAGPCISPDQTTGVCVRITHCSSFLSLLDQKPFLSDTTVDFLRQSECDFGREARVCCPIMVKNKEEITEKAKITKRERLPQPGECGVQEIEDKLLGGTWTEITEFPWMALLEYGDYNKPTLACGGSLISERFVLTAAHCVTGPAVSRYGNLQRIRLGEYDIKNSTDCVQNLGFNDCSDSLQRIDVDQIISHEGFNLRNRNRSHDIALVKMKHAVKYTEFIRPICLPPPYFILPKIFFVAGWGKTETTIQSNIKLKLRLPHFDHYSCSSIYAGLRFPVHLGPGQICAGGEEGKDSCTGDSGGPLMAFQQDQRFGTVWFQTGVVSFGPTPCGQTQPGVYTNVQEYLPWVHRTVTKTEI